MASSFANIREIIGHFIGRTIVEITQHDRDEWDEYGEAYVQLHFQDGSHLKFWTEERGFSFYEPDEAEDDDPSRAGGLPEAEEWDGPASI